MFNFLNGEKIWEITVGEKKINKAFRRNWKTATIRKEKKNILKEQRKILEDLKNVLEVS